jgi:hypothetical protein
VLKQRRIIRSMGTIKQWIKSLFGPSDYSIQMDKLHKESEEKRKELNNFFQNWKPLAMDKAEYIGDMLTITYNDGSVKQYKGESTVWRTYPMMGRCDSVLEYTLSDILCYIQEHGNPYPTAHLNKDQGVSKSQDKHDPETAGHPKLSARNV